MNDFIHQTSSDYCLSYNIVEKIYNRTIKIDKHDEFYSQLEDELDIHVKSMERTF